MYPSAVQALLCPVCADSFDVPASGAGALVCGSGHSFDIAKQGYINLLTGAGTRFTPDSAAMVEARSAFLAAGHYEPLADVLARIVASQLPAGPGSAPKIRPATLVVDAGTGTGYYLEHIRRLLDVASVGLDISKYALRRAARTNPETVNLVWDIWRPLPLAAGSAAAVVVVFAPRNAPEFARILRPGGILAVATPLPGHLAEIAGPAGLLGLQENKHEALESSMSGLFRPGPAQDLEFQLTLDREDVLRVAMMGPAGHHLDVSEVRAKVAGLPETSQVSARFRISLFEKAA
ncbi:MAG: methyltransferase domain-containing protein [Actinomycetota bacterium]|nr:methyltransferase domain-containing protein [Actinomycetota bacterium]